MTIHLREYQQEAIDSIYSYFESADGNPLVVAPTGSGKSVIIGGFVKGVFDLWPSQRILVVTHVRELVEQNFAKLKELWPQAPAGIYSASLGRRDVRASIVFASIQSIYTKAMALGWFDLVLIDEAHLIPEGGEGIYNQYLAALREINPKIKVIGFTATPWRMRSGHLIGDDTLFTDVAYDKCGIRYLVEQGHLCPVLPKPTRTQIDTAGVQLRGGEFVQRALQQLVDVDELTQAAVGEMLEYGGDRRSWLVFCTGVDHAFHVRDALRAAGISAETVTGRTPKQERAQIIARYKAGLVRALTNADVLTVGFDAPATDLLAVLRPTRSAGLWVQIIGRGMRTAQGKTDCLVLDFAGNSERHGPVDQIEMGRKKKRESGAGAPVRTCPVCFVGRHVSCLVCECGYEFPPPDNSDPHAGSASDASLLSFTGPAHNVREVNLLRFRRHKKPGKPDSIKVSYCFSLIEITSEWICLEHRGMARAKAKSWWRHWIGGEPPETTDEALERLGPSLDLGLQPGIITVKKNKYLEVTGWTTRQAG